MTVEQARALAQKWLAEVRRGGDLGAAKIAARSAPTIKELCEKFMADHSKLRNKPSTQKGYWKTINNNIIPLLGRMKVQDIKRPDVAAAMKKMAHKPADANHTFSVLRKMFNLAEVWGYRPDGTNPCRHLDHLEAEGLENYVIPLAIRLQFEFAARRSEIIALDCAAPGRLPLRPAVAQRPRQASHRGRILRRLAPGHHRDAAGPKPRSDNIDLMTLSGGGYPHLRPSWFAKSWKSGMVLQGAEARNTLHACLPSALAYPSRRERSFTPNLYAINVYYDCTLC